MLWFCPDDQFQNQGTSYSLRLCLIESQLMFPPSLLYLNNLGLKGNKAVHFERKWKTLFPTKHWQIICTAWVTDWNRLLPRWKQSQDVDGEPYCFAINKQEKGQKINKGKRCLCFKSLNPEVSPFFLDKAKCGFYKKIWQILDTGWNNALVLRKCLIHSELWGRKAFSFTHSETNPFLTFYSPIYLCGELKLQLHSITCFEFSIQNVRFFPS